ncbi:hypothetical protein DLJ53_19155 [Acuticoccus sediminis]|uniref:Uncharacterized protein n=1 Tax=Acuticoccus sediminis TaxID=2184697 RepID=A0A8B2NJR3_9HYPH|nr:DUF6074 family protein [Acuticoccus sediminis]RAH99864.1 hypothetical protein DLJ53_19155 [Acuticoccus sediminis]
MADVPDHLPLFKWSAQHARATVIPFPYARRRDDLAYRIARRAADFRPHKGEEHIQRQLKLQFDTMKRRGIDDDRIRAEIRVLETMVRLEQAALQTHWGDAG